jgi:uncharacterized FAD-dependent dehydrogenase
MAWMVREIEWREGVDPHEAVAQRMGVPIGGVRDVTLVKKSLDARQRKKRWWAVYRVALHEGVAPREPLAKGVRRWTGRDEGRYGLADGAPARRSWPADQRPVVVGAGPAGLFAALFLAEAGAQVTLIERGGPVESRIQAVNGFWRGRAPLDPENNLVFGEGGAGTFSDGKIYTRRRDGELGFIFRRLVDFGADPSVFTDALAHLGTDRIRALLPPFRERLQQLGVELRYSTVVESLIVEGGRCVGVRLQGGEELRRAPVIVATGHSARDATQMMVEAGAAARARGIAIGVRVEHPQALIDRSRYRRADRGELPPASYRLAHHVEGGVRGRTFCMCPGGMVVPASNHPDRVVVNGMSFAARRAFWANSAVIVEVEPSVYGGAGPLAGFDWQDRIERACFEATGSYAAPAQRVVDFLEGVPSTEVPRTSYPMGVQAGGLHDVLPEVVCRGLSETLRAFEQQLPGFVSPDAVMIAPETRTTSPVQFERTKGGESTTLPGLFPAGEGAGYAGGIVSSALDGLRAARHLAASVV